MGITGKTGVIGIFGCPITHSLSPVMHNSAFSKMNLDYVYVPFFVHPDNLEAAVKGACAMGVLGLNITVPHKEAIIPFLDEVSEDASLLEAVNTVDIRDGRLIGYNTDGLGFIRSIKESFGCSPKNKRVGILGAGGAARGVGISLALAGAKEITFFNRTEEKAKKLADEIQKKTSADSNGFSLNPIFLKNLKTVDILINGTSLGMKENDQEVLASEWFPESGVVVDMVYNPPKTRFLRTAEALGLKYINGMGMLVHQGALAFEIWTSVKAPVERMQSVLAKVVYDDK